MNEKYVSFCFDDGFQASADKIRGIFAQRALSACFCVLAAPELADDPFIRGAQIADWSYWRDAVAEGHEVAPHGFAHEHLGKLDFAAACDSVRRTLDAFTNEFAEFDPATSLYHLAYLGAPAPVVQWIGQHTLGVRMALGRAGRNELAGWSRGAPVDCITFAPPEADQASRRRLEHFLAEESGWLVLVFHGLDGEGWGTLSADALAWMLDACVSSGVKVKTPNRMLLSPPPR